MTDWGGGYVTDVEYIQGFYVDQSPHRMALATIMNGFRAPSFEGPFAYCELGCGQGLTSQVLATAYPLGDFHGIDFNPAHIAHGRREAARLGLTNLHFHECSFTDLDDDAAAFPMFDAISMHGIWSWVSDEQQQAVLKFINQHLNPGGLVYVSFNALPGWSRAAPLQRLIRELSLETPARSDVAVKRAIETLNRLDSEKLIHDGLAIGMKRINASVEKGHFAYLAHEYLNEHWRPVFHADVAKAFASAKLTFAASTDLIRNFQNVTLNQSQREALASIENSALRETLKDFNDDIWFRKDVYVRGAARLTGAEREAWLGDLELALVRPAPKTFSVQRSNGEVWQPEALVYQPILKALERGSARVKELVALPDVPHEYRATALEVAGVLLSTPFVAQKIPQCEDGGARGRNVNRKVDIDNPAIFAGATLMTSSSMAIAAPFLAIDLVLYEGLREAPEDPPDVMARRFIDLCAKAGAPLIVEGETISEPEKAQKILADELSLRRAAFERIWRGMDLI